MENKETIGLIKQRLEILYQMVEQLEQGGGGSPSDAYTKAQTDALLNGKVDKVVGSSLMTTAQANKLAGIQSGAEVNVQANWNETDTTSDSYIRNKPTIPDLTNYYNKTETTAQIQGAIADLDVSQTASTGHYIDYISQEDGLIVPHSKLSSTVPTTDDTTLITSGGVKTALGNYYNKTEVDNKDGAILENDGVKNLVGYNLTVPQELTATVNADGSLTVVANTTAIRRLTIATDLSKLVDGNTYILSGCSDGNSDTTYHLGITKSNYAGLVYQANSEVSFTKTSEMALLVLTVRARQNWTKTFYPMIRKASIGNSDFVRYAPNNYELWEMIKAIQPATTNSLRTLNSQEEVEEGDDTNGDYR